MNEVALEVDPECVRTFIEATGDDPDLYPDSIAPALFLASQATIAWRAQLVTTRRTLPAVVHVGQRIRIRRPVRAGERVRFRTEVAGVGTVGLHEGCALSTVAVDTNNDSVMDLLAVLQVNAQLGAAGQLDPMLLSVPLPPTDGPTHCISRIVGRDAIQAYSRLSGDDNPIHLDEASARAAGFAGPVAHGMLILATGCAVLSHVDGRPGAPELRAVLARFTKPVYSQSTIEFRVSGAGRNIQLSAIAGGRRVMRTQIELA